MNEIRQMFVSRAHIVVAAMLLLAMAVCCRHVMHADDCIRMS